jgi:hypothetical protein
MSDDMIPHPRPIAEWAGDRICSTRHPQNPNDRLIHVGDKPVGVWECLGVNLYRSPDGAIGNRLGRLVIHWLERGGKYDRHYLHKFGDFPDPRPL